MAYLIAGVVVALFLALYLVSKPKIREEYSKVLSNDEYLDLSYNFVKSMSLPKNKGVDLHVDYFVSAIKSSLRILKTKRFKAKFDNVLKLEGAIRSLAKRDFSELNGLLSIDGTPRIVGIAEFCLKSNDFKFSGERIATIINNQNRVWTLSFDEILALDKAFLFVIVKKIAFLLEECKTVCKMMDLAKKCTKNKVDFENNKNFNALKNNKLFLSFCADYTKYASEECLQAQENFFANIENEFEKVFNLAKNIEKIDFSAFYAPLAILSRYESFDEASRAEKINFLKLLKLICDKENIDEYYYAIRLDNYQKTASAGHIDVFRAPLFSRKLSVVFARKDITSLSAALSSKTMMTLLFGGNNAEKPSNSILKINKFENTFEPVSRFKALNFGISIQNDRLKLRPHLPKDVESVEFVLKHCGVAHCVHIERGEIKQLYLDETKLTGTSEIYLKDKPLKIKLIIPFGD